MMSPPCEYLEWDSNFFGLRIARYRGHLLRKEELQAADKWCREENIDCLYLLAESSDARTIELAESNQFHFVDARVQMEADTHPSSCPPSSVRPARPEDLETLQRIARVSHGDSRFFFDHRFPRSRVEDLYAEWIARSVGGWASSVLVCKVAGQVAGYISCHLSDQGSGSIGLLAVDQEQRGRGLGQQLLSGAMQIFEQGGARTVSVVTQARNIDSQRLYQKAGFRTRSVQLWFHRWFAKNC